MTEASVVYTQELDSYQAGADLGRRMRDALAGTADVAILFVSPTYQLPEFLQAFKAACEPRVMMGCSSAGEFITKEHGAGGASAVGIRSAEMRFTASIGRSLRCAPENAINQLLQGFQGLAPDIASPFQYRSALIFTDALTGVNDALVDQLIARTGGQYQFFGGGAGDNAQFVRTPVFYDTDVVSNAVVALEILSRKPLGIGVRHGWEPISEEYEATEVDGMWLLKLDGRPALEVFQQHARETGQTLDIADPLPFFLGNLIGVETGLSYRLRVPLAVTPEGAILCAAEIPDNAIIRIMNCSSLSVREAAVRAIEAAMQKLGTSKPAVALFFECVATRLLIGDDFGFELADVQAALGDAQMAGCNTHGQIAWAPGQFNGFHNCTAVTCLIPA